MIEYCIANYLIEEGRITNEQFGELLNKQDAARVKLGLIAVSEGLITKAQADEINRLQMTRDARFGDIAVDLGYLREDQITMLLRMQGSSYHAFLQVLTDEGIIKLEEADEIMKKVRLKEGLSTADIDAIKEGVVERILPIYMQDIPQPMIDLAGVLLRTIVRIADRHAFIEKAEIYSSYELKYAEVQEFGGETGKFVTAYEDVHGGLVLLASAFAKEAFKCIDEDSLDAVGEFENIVNGLYCSKLSKSDINFDLEPQHTVESGTVTGVVCVLPVRIRNKKFNFIVCDKI